MIENDCPSQNNASRAFFKGKQTFFSLRLEYVTILMQGREFLAILTGFHNF